MNRKNDKDDFKLDLEDPGTNLFFGITKAIAGLSCLKTVPFASNVEFKRYLFSFIVEQFNATMLNMSSDTLLDQSRSDI